MKRGYWIATGLFCLLFVTGGRPVVVLPIGVASYHLRPDSRRLPQTKLAAEPRLGGTPASMPGAH